MGRVTRIKRWRAVFTMMLCSVLGVGWLPHGRAEASTMPSVHPARALWVWNTRNLVMDPAARAEFFLFLAETKVEINSGAQGIDLSSRSVRCESRTDCTEPRANTYCFNVRGSMNALSTAQAWSGFFVVDTMKKVPELC